MFFIAFKPYFIGVLSHKAALQQPLQISRIAIDGLVNRPYSRAVACMNDQELVEVICYQAAFNLHPPVACYNRRLFLLE